MIFLLRVGDPAVPNLYQPTRHLNNNQPARPFGERIAYQRKVVRIANKREFADYFLFWGG
jgi:hypothetical protein